MQMKCEVGIILVAMLGIVGGQFADRSLKMIYNSGQETTMYPNSETNTNTSFTYNSETFNCSAPQLFFYNMSKYPKTFSLSLSGVITSTTITFSSRFNHIQPQFANGQNTATCNSNCVLQVTNVCPGAISYLNYFDRIYVELSGVSDKMEYYAICQSDYQNVVEWGLVILITFTTIFIFVMAIYSKAWSLGSFGIEIKIWIVIAFNGCLIIGGIIGHFSNQALQIILFILSVVLSVIGVTLCSNQILFLFKNKTLNQPLLKTPIVQVRILDIIGILISIALILGWYFSQKNWIISDILGICIIVACIKILKFTSLMVATFCFILTMLVQLSFIIVIFYITGESYNNLFINNYNFPILMQLPTINAVFQQKCSWLPFTAIVYPGMLLSYLRRFDSSRSTTVYLIMSTVLFFLGAIAWNFVNFASPFSFPLGIISETTMIILVIVFAYRRREIKTIWNGLFFDEQFKNRGDFKQVIELITHEKRPSELTIGREDLMNLKIRGRDSHNINGSRISDSLFDNSFVTDFNQEKDKHKEKESESERKRSSSGI